MKSEVKGTATSKMLGNTVLDVSFDNSTHMTVPVSGAVFLCRVTDLDEEFISARERT
jgi:hypothetical protein